MRTFTVAKIGFKDGEIIPVGETDTLTFEIIEDNSTGYSFKHFEMTVSGLTSDSKALLKGVARKYEASVSEPSEDSLSFILAVEQEDTLNDWLFTLVGEMKTLHNKYN